MPLAVVLPVVAAQLGLKPRLLLASPEMVMLLAMAAVFAERLEWSSSRASSRRQNTR